MKQGVKVILGFILLAGLIIGGYFIYDYFKNREDTPDINLIQMNIKALNNQTPINSTICFYNDDTSLVKCSNSTGNWESFNLKETYNYTLLVKSDGYYSEIRNIIATRNNIEVPMETRGSINTTQEREIKEGEHYATITIKADGILKKLTICTRPSIGFIWANVTKHTKYCDGWLNSSLTLYQCNTSLQYWECDNVINKTCYLKSEIPAFLNTTPRGCYFTGFDLNNENKTIEIEYNSWQLLYSDYIDVWILDQDIILKNGVFMYGFSEIDEGIPTQKIRLQ